MNKTPIRTKVYYVAKQPPDVRVYAVLISEHENEMFYGTVLHVLDEMSAGIEQAGEIRGRFICAESEEEVKRIILKWLEEKNAGGNQLIEK
jgi:hypothetical protein